MAITQLLPTSLLTNIAAQISAAMPGAILLGAASGLPSEIGESLDIYVLGAQDVTIGATLADKALPLGSFYHLIYQDDQPAGQARSSVDLGGNTSQLTEVSSDLVLAGLVHNALGAIDKLFPADHWLVSMLMVPAYHVTGLWIRGQGQSRVCTLLSDADALPVNNPSATTEGDLTIDERDFMDRLLSATVIQGLV